MEKAIAITAKLYECRDTTKLLLGERYAEVMGNYGRAIEKVAGAHRCSQIEAAKKMATETQDGKSRMLIFAAVVELAEPSSAT